jgi:hypothetical protein
MKEARVRQAYEQVLTTMRRAHEVAVDRRRVVVLTFANQAGNAPATITFTQEVFTPGVGGNPGVYSLAPMVNTPNPEVISLPSDMDFALPSTPPGISPDNMPASGKPAGPIDFGYSAAVGGSGKKTMFFQADGTVLRDSEIGAVASGVVYVGRASDANSNRAVSILGSTGRVKGWRTDAAGKTWIAY